MRRAFAAPVLIPVLLSVALVLDQLPARSAGAVLARDAGWSVVFAASAGVMAALVARGVASHEGRRVVIGVFLALWIAAFGTLRLHVGPMLGVSPTVLLAGWSTVIAVGVLLSRHSRALGPDAQRGVLVGLTALVAMQGASVTRRVMHTPLTPRVDAAPATVWVDARAQDRPDLYVIVLDKFSHPRHLAARYGLDLAPFVDSLRALGFTVPERARTNYVHTQMALVALLDGRPLHDDTPGADDGGAWVRIGARLAAPTAWDALATRGYRMVFFPTGFPATTQRAGSQLSITAPSAAAAQRRGETWRLSTPFALLAGLRCQFQDCAAMGGFPYPVESATALRWKLDVLGTLPDSAGPVAAFVHFLGSHEPYVFNADCSERTPWWPVSDFGPDSLAIREAYAAQIHCVSTLILRTVRQLIARSAVPPVILLQSDHGHGNIARDPVRGLTLSYAEATPQQVAERLDVFAAYLFPGSTRSVPDSITPVNLLPTVFDALFGTATPRAPDASYWSSFHRPLDLTLVPHPPR
jgi:hypothetical protein